ncbi:choice-of-anchor E domain-containing protein [Salipiger sp. 1_MG-2023]|uniref:choice-of-anchor E domain-containing protein n=1 Tax=Salipiger sp. 1_MG-2023 TaxID=3062665 RepID=UPI0026E345FF|nr:choice-of-anchor E domain-containing protein [Salipiger sp. 1_MG-2023]MDO6583920.1 choice-of-anchor E domain-containing protein [Salipiger sp. 1_MG-2023]
MNLFTTSAAAVLLFAGAANAATVSYSASIATSTTSWEDSVALSMFDETLGTLNSVTLSLYGTASGTAKAESLDASPADVSLSLGANIVGTYTGYGFDVSVNPLANSVTSLSAYDGTIDFAGTSGVTYEGLTADDTDSATFTSALEAFIGTGTFTLDLAAQGNSSGTGAGNLITQFATSAGATAYVIYDYTPTSTVPLPAGAPLLLLGVGGIALLRRRKTA